jgi:hypothetical protein
VSTSCTFSVRRSTMNGLKMIDPSVPDPDAASENSCCPGGLPRGGERRKNEAENEREPDQAHGHLGWGWLPGSLADLDHSRLAGSSVQLSPAPHATCPLYCLCSRSATSSIQTVPGASMTKRRSI